MRFATFKVSPPSSIFCCRFLRALLHSTKHWHAGSSWISFGRSAGNGAYHWHEAKHEQEGHWNNQPRQRTSNIVTLQHRESRCLLFSHYYVSKRRRKKRKQVAKAIDFFLLKTLWELGIVVCCECLSLALSHSYFHKVGNLSFLVSPFTRLVRDRWYFLGVVWGFSLPCFSWFLTFPLDLVA